jgi:hypothetical protein
VELSKHLVWAVPDGPRWEAEHAVAGDPERILACHVGPPLPDVGVLATVDLDVQPPLGEVGIQIAPAAVVVAPDVLK